MKKPIFSKNRNFSSSKEQAIQTLENAIEHIKMSDKKYFAINNGVIEISSSNAPIKKDLKYAGILKLKPMHNLKKDCHYIVKEDDYYLIEIEEHDLFVEYNNQKFRGGLGIYDITSIVTLKGFNTLNSKIRKSCNSCITILEDYQMQEYGLSKRQLDKNDVFAEIHPFNMNWTDDISTLPFLNIQEFTESRYCL